MKYLQYPREYRPTHAVGKVTKMLSYLKVLILTRDGDTVCDKTGTLANTGFCCEKDLYKKIAILDWYSTSLEANRVDLCN